MCCDPKQEEHRYVQFADMDGAPTHNAIMSARELGEYLFRNADVTMLAVDVQEECPLHHRVNLTEEERGVSHE